MCQRCTAVEDDVALPHLAQRARSERMVQRIHPSASWTAECVMCNVLSQPGRAPGSTDLATSLLRWWGNQMNPMKNYSDPVIIKIITQMMTGNRVS